jgi:hypothetical protein
VIDSFKKEGEEWKASREGRRQNASRQGEELPKRGAEAENRGGAAVDDHRFTGHPQRIPTGTHACTHLLYIHSETLCARVYALVGTWRRALS